MKKNKEDFRKLMNQRNTNPIENLKKFIGVYYANSFDVEEIKGLMKQILSYNKITIENGLEAAKIVLEDSKYDQELIEMILWEANQPLQEPLKDQAKTWLKEQIVFTEKILNEFKKNNLD